MDGIRHGCYFPSPRMWPFMSYIRFDVAPQSPVNDQLWMTTRGTQRLMPWDWWRWFAWPTLRAWTHRGR